MGLESGSVADPGCLSRIPNPDFCPSRIQDPGSKNSNKREGWKKIWCHTFLCSHKFHKIVHYFSFEVLKKKILANFQRIIELFTQKIVTKLSKIWVWNPGSRGQKGTGSRNTGCCLFHVIRQPVPSRHCSPWEGKLRLVREKTFTVPVLRLHASYILPYSLNIEKGGASQSSDECSGSESGSTGSTCFWASRIRIH